LLQRVLHSGGALRASYFVLRSRNAGSLDGVLLLISRGTIPPAPPGSPVLEVDPPGSNSVTASVAAALIFVVAMVVAFFLDASTILLFAPLSIFVVGQAVRRLRYEALPELELRTDGLVVRRLLFGRELWVPWGAIADVDSNSMAEHVVNIELARLDTTRMDASLARVLESAFLSSFGRHLIAVPVPSDMLKDHFITLLDRRVLDSARKDVGLLGGVDRENTV